MSRSLVYASPWLYESIMAVLYGQYYRQRQATIAALIPAGASVLDVCCGPGTLYTGHLKQSGNSYCGIDLNERFIQRVVRAGGQGIVAAVDELEQFPAADYCIMQASLYHFLPDPHPILRKMLAAARQRVIVSEPIRNLSTGGLPLLSWLARRSTDAGTGQQARRFTAESLQEVFSRYEALVLERKLIPGGREAYYVLDATAEAKARLVA